MSDDLNPYEPPETEGSLVDQPASPDEADASESRTMTYLMAAIVVCVLFGLLVSG